MIVELMCGMCSGLCDHVGLPCFPAAVAAGVGVAGGATAGGVGIVGRHVSPYQFCLGRE